MRPTADANQSAERKQTTGDQSAEQVMLRALRQIGARSLIDIRDDEAELRRQLHHINCIAHIAINAAEGK